MLQLCYIQQLSLFSLIIIFVLDFIMNFNIERDSEYLDK